MAKELEAPPIEKSTAKKRGIYSIRKWCEINGYGGVTSECTSSAMQSGDPQIRKMAKRAKLTSMIKR